MLIRKLVILKLILAAELGKSTTTNLRESEAKEGELSKENKSVRLLPAKKGAFSVCLKDSFVIRFVTSAISPYETH